MLENLSLQSFKCFVKADIDLAKLTLLTGLNSSGKSSAMQAIRIIRDKKLLEGYGNCVSSLADVATIKLQTQRSQITARITKDSQAIDFEDKDRLDICENIQYISANRRGPAAFLPFKNKINDVGEQGENVLSLLPNCKNGVPEKLRRTGYEIYTGVVEQLKAWLHIIAPGVEFDYDIVSNADIAYSSFSTFRSVDVGFGLSYTLPIIASVLINSVKADTQSEYPVLLIENPEAHLHPRGQTEMGQFLALAASCGVQIIVETHSDHLLNGIRIAVKNDDIAPDDTIFHYFEHDSDAEKSNHYPIYIDQHGMLDNWPNGFFDENEKNLLRLL